MASPLAVEDGNVNPERRAPSLAGQFNYEAREVLPYPVVIRWIRTRIFRLFIVLVYVGTVVLLIIEYLVMTDRNETLLGIPCSHIWKQHLKYYSIPLVSIIFTWWHVWLGIQMCFYPVEFWGWPPYFGWQGIVPRRSHIMATRSCDIMIGSLITIEEIIDRIEPEDFFESLGSVLAETNAAVLSKLATKHWPAVWNRLPAGVKQELESCVLEESKNMFTPVITELKRTINTIVDIKQMSIDILTENKALLVQVFQDIGQREFTFIQHVAAVMGFLLGVLQMVMWVILNASGHRSCAVAPESHSFRCWGGFVILPVTGLFIGYFTNWLGITMIFRPVNQHIVCGGYVNVQGVFLKRQVEVSKKMAAMICQHLIHARKLLEYIVKKQDTMTMVLDIYQRHTSIAVDKAMGTAKSIIPIFVGKGAVDGIKQDALDLTLEELPSHSREIERYMDRAFGLSDTLAYRLSRLPPDRFEGMLHPVFQEDEWMILLLGGVLGVIVGTLQALALGS